MRLLESEPVRHALIGQLCTVIGKTARLLNKWILELFPYNDDNLTQLRAVF